MPRGGGGGGATAAAAGEEEELDRISKRRWSSEEDAALRKLVDKYEARNWALISSRIAGRSFRSCRQRWYNHLSPVEDRPFTAAEEATIAQAHAQHGSRWATIARLLPGRTDMAIKNHWLRRQCSAAAAENGGGGSGAADTEVIGTAARSNASGPRSLPPPCPGSSSKPSSSGHTLKEQLLNTLVDPSFPGYVNEVEKIWHEIESNVESLHRPSG